MWYHFSSRQPPVNGNIIVAIVTHQGPRVVTYINGFWYTSGTVMKRVYFDMWTEVEAP